MKLYTGPTTPFGRMVEIVAREAGVALDVEVISVATAEFLDALNPLRLVPTLVLDEGRAVYDSRVICRLLAAMAPRSGLVPGDADWAFEVRLALISGIMDAGVARQGERSRPQETRSAAAIAVHERRILKGIAVLEADAEEICRPAPRLDRIAAAVLLDYTDFRYGRDWRGVAPRLAAWLDGELQRPSMVETRFGR